MEKKKILDIAIIILAVIGYIVVSYFLKESQLHTLYRVVFLMIALFVIIDLIRISNKKPLQLSQPLGVPIITRVTLMGEDNQLVRSWELQGKTALIIGKKEEKYEVDVDLEESEYSALIDNQHAILNYAGGEWYIEDLYSKNGIRVQKQEDGLCYKIAKDKPCKLCKGDIVLIANTKLLFR